VRTIDRLVAVLNGGDDGAEATRQYREIMDRLANYVHEHGGRHKAKLTLAIEFVADAKGLDVALRSPAQRPSS
jgi:hypothetical protein